MEFFADRRYLSFPVRNGTPLTRFVLRTDAMRWQMDLELVPPERAAFWTYFDAVFCQGQTLSLEPLGDAPDGWQAWVLLDDSFPGRARLFQERSRPLYHFSNSRGWINDPNGLVKKNGKYHMFYQLNPFGCRGFDKGWGHCQSENLFDWEILPPALSADEDGYAISGSTLFDRDNRAGFGADAWIMLYSSRTHLCPEKGQQQNLAYSLDGKIFHKYAGNPVLREGQAPDFRDPKVFWHEKSQSFVMLVTMGRQLRFYRSQNLKQWVLSSVADNSLINPQNWIYECPELMEYTLCGTGRKLWVLSVSFIEDRSVRFVFGEFDGWRFRADPEIPVQRADYGRDFYAAVGWDPYGQMQGRHLWIGWMCYWPYSDQLPKDEGWLNLFTVPRELCLVENSRGIPVMRQSPAEELEQLVTSRCPFPDFVVENARQSFELPGACRIRGKLSCESGGDLTMVFSFSAAEAVQIRICPREGILEADRSGCNAYGIGEGYGQVQKMPIHPGGEIPFTILLDNSCMELYFDHGEHCMCLLCYSQGHDNRLILEGTGGKFVFRDFSVDRIRRAEWKF